MKDTKNLSRLNERTNVRIFELIDEPIGHATVLYSYAGQTTDELSVEVGIAVDILSKPDPLWWRVRDAQGNSGMLPATYLEEATSG